MWLGPRQRVYLRMLYLQDWDGRSEQVDRRRRSAEVRTLESLRRYGLCDIVRQEEDALDRRYRITQEGRLIGRNKISLAWNLRSRLPQNLR